MKLSTNNNNYATTITKTADFGIEEEDMSHIMGILSSQVYTNKLLAVIREYSTNARDANIEAGYPNTAIDVTLPTFNYPELSFRDYGYGLTDEEVCNLYVKYGASTKRNSNDYTGCLGIGCKAAFAYGDQFTIKSYTGNKVTTWLAAINESKRGTISLISSRDRLHNEATGVQVSVHIKKQDLDQCQREAMNFFRYWKPEEINCNIDIEHAEYHTETDDWALLQHTKDANEYSRYHAHNGKATILMGHIAYPVDTNQCTDMEEAGALLNNNQVVIKAPLGCLEIAANREALEYTDKTKQSINALANKLRQDLIKLVNDSIDKQPTRLLASINAHTLAGILGYTISEQLTKNASWKGKPLLNNIKFNSDTTKHYKKKNWRDDTYRNHRDKDVYSTTLSPNTRLVLWDSDNIAETNATRRIRTLQEQDDTLTKIEYYVIRKENLNKIEPKLEPNDYTDLSNITPLKPKRTIITKADGTKVKSVKISVCHLKSASLKASRLSKEAEPIANEAGHYIYVPLDRFDWLGRTEALDNLFEIQNTVNYLADEEIKIHGVKKHYLKNLDENWIKLDDYLIQLWKAWTKRNREHTAALLLAAEPVEFDHRWQAPEVLSHVKDKSISYTAKILLMKENHKRDIDGHENQKMRSAFNTLKWLNLIEIPNDMLNNIVLEINKQFPLLKEIEEAKTWNGRMTAPEVAHELNKYINNCK